MSLVQRIADTMSQRLENGSSAQTVTRSYVAAEDSADGVVKVYSDSEVISEDDASTIIDVPCIGSVKAGDTVYVTAYGTGALKRVIAHGGEGWGDSVQAEVKDLNAMIMQLSTGTLVCYPQGSIGAFVNASGSFDVVEISSWQYDASIDSYVPVLAGRLASYGTSSTEMLSGHATIEGTTYGQDGYTVELVSIGAFSLSLGDYNKAKLSISAPNPSGSKDGNIIVSENDETLLMVAVPITDWQYLYGSKNDGYWTRWRCWNGLVEVDWYYANVGFDVAGTTASYLTGIPNKYTPDSIECESIPVPVGNSVGIGYAWVEPDTVNHAPKVGVRATGTTRTFIARLVYHPDPFASIFA